MADPVLPLQAPVDVPPVVPSPPVTPVIPPGIIPPTDPAAPAWALTQAQIDALLNFAGSIWPSFKTYWPIIALIAASFGVGGGVLGRVTAPVTPAVVDVKPADKPAPPIIINVPPPVAPVAPVSPVSPLPTPIKAGCQCGCVTTGKCVCKDCDHPMLVKPAPIVPPGPVLPLAQRSLILHTTPALDAKAIAADPSVKGLALTVSVDPKVWPAGSYYPWNGKSISLPCMALLDAGGKVLDVAPFANAADVASFAKKNEAAK